MEQQLQLASRCGVKGHRQADLVPERRKHKPLKREFSDCLACRHPARLHVTRAKSPEWIQECTYEGCKCGEHVDLRQRNLGPPCGRCKEVRNIRQEGWAAGLRDEHAIWVQKFGVPTGTLPHKALVKARSEALEEAIKLVDEWNGPHPSEVFTIEDLKAAIRGSGGGK